MKRTLSKWLVLLTTAGLLGILLPSCAWQIGGDKKGTTVMQPTRGQELMDLKKARDQGALSEPEYQAQRQKILQH